MSDFSVVDSFPFQLNPFPQLPANALHRQGSRLDMTDKQWDEFQDIWLKYPLVEATEPMIAYLIDQGIPFECPLCGNSGMRQVVEMINDVFDGVRDVPCCCEYGDARVINAAISADVNAMRALFNMPSDEDEELPL